MALKIAIIGAGPIGCYTAHLLKKYGYDVVIVEEHDEVGRPVHCTGLVGRNVFTDGWPYKILSSSKINTINGAIIHHERDHFAIGRKSVAYVIDREKFDKELSKGLDILYRNRFLGLEKARQGYIIETDKNEIPADIVIGADGANSVVRRILNHNTNIRYSKGVQLRIKTPPAHKDMVEVYLKKGSFFWIVPESAEVVRAGTISENPYRDLQRFLKELKVRGDVLERFGGLAITGLCGVTSRDNIALVGDAACQVKPITYGGIYFGLRAALILAGCIKKGMVDQYDRLWKKELEFEVRIGLMVKNIYDRLNPQEMGKIFRMVKRHRPLVERIGDFENHSRLIMAIMKKPSTYAEMGELFQILFKKLV